MSCAHRTNPNPAGPAGAQAHGAAKLLSTPNLIVNGGFSTGTTGWSLDARPGVDSSWHRTDMPDMDRNGCPHSAFALRCDGRAGEAETGLSQQIAVHAVPSRRFAFRVTARGSGPGAEASVTIDILDADTSDGRTRIGRFPLSLSSQWQRHRVQFDIPAGARRPVIEIELRGNGCTGSSADVTDLRLVGLLAPVPDIAVRLDTCADILRASARLRAFLIEDYLHLLGCRTSLNGGRAFDLLVCQKIEPWLTLAAARAAGRPVVFDLDDNDLLISRLRAFQVRWFARLVDGMTVGSEFLRDMAGRWTTRTFLLENQVDVLDRQVARDDGPWNDRLVWFGMPENRWMVDRLDLDRPVSTITRGGDIEYGLKTVDRDLVSFDLALLPVPINDETLAKNANRLVKCVALGLPFLASDTVEHRRALAALRLPEDFLVASDGEWKSRITDIARRYPYYRELVAAAREHAYDVYGVERIAAGWLAFCADLVRAREARHQ